MDGRTHDGRFNRVRWDTKCKLSSSLYAVYYRCAIFIDREALVKQGDIGIGSVRRSVRVWVCLSALVSDLSCLNRLTFDIELWHEGRP